MVTASLSTSSALLPPLGHRPSGRSRCLQASFPSTATPLRLPAGCRSTRRQLKVIRAVEAEKGAASGDQGGFSILNLPEWAKWALGASVWLALPVVNKIRDVGNLIARVDTVVEKVEEMAEKADKIAEDLAEDLPEGKIKDMALKVEKTSELVVSRAKVLDDILDKISKFLEDMTNAGSKDGTSTVTPSAAGSQDKKVAGGASGAVVASNSTSSGDNDKPRSS